jgi:hypothetical protein
MSIESSVPALSLAFAEIVPGLASFVVIFSVLSAGSGVPAIGSMVTPSGTWRASAR